MKNSILILLLYISIITIQTGCGNDDDNVTPSSSTQSDPNTGAIKSGSISGSVNTTTTTNQTQNYTYNFEYSGGPVVYNPATNKVFFYQYKSFNTGFTGNTDYASGNATFGASDSIKSAPTAYSFSLAASNSVTNGIFLFSTGNDLTQTNSTISNYSYSGGTIKFKITSNGGYLGSNGKAATVVMNINIPVSIGVLRMASE